MNTKFARRWIDLTVPLAQGACLYGRQLQVRVDSHTLNLVRSGERSAARAMADISIGLAGQHADLMPRVFWQISAAYFEALALGLTVVELSGKKALTGILLQYRALAQGACTVPESLMNDLLGLVAQAKAVSVTEAPLLGAVQLAYCKGGAGVSDSALASTDADGTLQPVPQGEHADAQDQDRHQDQDQDQDQDQVKVIGHLRVPISSFNSYLNEADEWSRRLQLDLSEWALDLQQPLGEDSIALARALALSSERIGLLAVEQMAVALTHALSRVKTLSPERPPQTGLLTDAANDIRRLLHQFAAGFIKSPDQKLLEQLESLVQGAAWSAPASSATHDDRAAVFFANAAVTLLQLGGALRQWRARPDNVGARNETLRALQALKKDALLAGVSSIYERADGLESGIVRLGTQTLQAQQLAPLLLDFEGLRVYLGQLQQAPD